MEIEMNLVVVVNYYMGNQLHSLKTTKMEIKELTVGNWIFDEDDILCKINGFKPYDHSVRCDEKEGCLVLIDLYPQDESVRRGYECDLNSIKPIPLTEEVLLKCGASETESYTYEFTQIGKDIDLCVKFCEYDICVTIWQNDPIYLRYDFVDFYLHTLQNLIFALTGEELTYNHS